jgi:hypothetical protein
MQSGARSSAIAFGSGCPWPPGIEGVLLAQRSYKPQLGFKFWPYARYVVRRTIFDEVRRKLFDRWKAQRDPT